MSVTRYTWSCMTQRGYPEPWPLSSAEDGMAGHRAAAQEPRGSRGSEMNGQPRDEGAWSCTMG
jgi:hypothetical protein